MRKRRSRFLQIWALLPRPCRSPLVRKRTLRKRRMMRTGLVVMTERVPGLRVYYRRQETPPEQQTGVSPEWSYEPREPLSSLNSQHMPHSPSPPLSPELPRPPLAPPTPGHKPKLPSPSPARQKNKSPKRGAGSAPTGVLGRPLMLTHPRPIRRQERGHPLGPKAPAAQGQALPFWVQLDVVGLDLLQMIVLVMASSELMIQEMRILRTLLLL